ncbi:MAG: UbiA family prenyltransferase [bacterium]|nr:UbiA family prenyltransferase [bacterium]
MWNNYTSISITMKWAEFIKERFPIREHLPFILIFFFSCYLFAFKTTELAPKINFNTFSSLITTILIFFHLRLLDEIKDIERDKIIHPNRPLAKGLIKISEAKIMITSVILIEIILNISSGISTLIALSSVIFFSFLMYKEFFVKTWLRKHPIIYAFSHAIIMPIICIYIYYSNLNNIDIPIPEKYMVFSMFNWVVSNIFEFSRKMLLKNEEGYEDSYINQIGYYKTILIQYFMIITTTFFIIYTAINKVAETTIITVILILVSIPFLKPNHQREKLFKYLGYFSILFFYIFIITFSLIKMKPY